MNFSRRLTHNSRFCFIVFLLITVISLAGCSSETPGVISPSQPAPAENTASALLKEAQSAAKNMNKYGFQLQLTQKVTGAVEADNANVKIDMQGRAERNPLKIDQTVKSDIDGEVSSLRTVIVPEAYYMYIPEFEEWSKLSKTNAADNVKTLSDFQVNPEKALKDIQTLGNSLKEEKTGDTITIKYAGSDDQAKSFLEGLLESTMSLSSFDRSVRDSLFLQKLNVTVTLDAQKHWPLTYRIESAMTLEFEPGKKSTVHQTLAGTYSKHNVSAAVTVPEEAKNALDPDEMAEELNSHLK